MDHNDLVNRFTYHAPKERQPEIYKALRDQGRHKERTGVLRASLEG